MLSGLPSRSIVRLVSVASIISPLTSLPFFCLTKSFSLVAIFCTAAQSWNEPDCCANASGVWLERRNKTRTAESGFIGFFFAKEQLQALFLLVLVNNCGGSDKRRRKNRTSRRFTS